MQNAVDYESIENCDRPFAGKAMVFGSLLLVTWLLTFFGLDLQQSSQLLSKQKHDTTGKMILGIHLPMKYLFSTVESLIKC